MSLFARYILPITVLAAVGSGLMAGLLFAFSNFVMKALTRLPPEQGMAAMQLINVTIINPVSSYCFLEPLFYAQSWLYTLSFSGKVPQLSGCWLAVSSTLLAQWA